MKNYCKKYYKAAPKHGKTHRQERALPPAVPVLEQKKPFDINTWDPHLVDRYLLP
jgi:hypothetical protein